MAKFKPFKAVRPLPEYAKDVAAPPYDVMNSDEAREMVEGKPYSFLHVDKAEIDLPEGIDMYSESVYLKAKENLDKLVSDSICKEDEAECLYIYRQTMDGRSQNGLVGCASIDDYLNNIIKKHEFTRAEKEADRINHVDYCDANTGPIFLTYRERDDINTTIEKWKNEHDAVYDFTTDDDVRHTVWVVDCPETIEFLRAALAKVDYLYIADGHHRAASAVKVGQKRRKANPNYTGEEEFNCFLAVLFAKNELEIMDYNRVVKDLNGNTPEQFLEKVEEKFEVVEAPNSQPFKPSEKHSFGMFLDGKWYKITAKKSTFNENDPVDRLDVSILQNNLLTPILLIGDPRIDNRIDFVGGIRGLSELEHRVNTDMKVAISMYPTTLDDLMDIADADKIMPPKSTWFEPKLLSGLFVHKLS
ncbi:MAG TPA: DUF1015 family protein [Clostridia bacterium]|nr:DUF1015 family protein [Clostridia bacterium]